jgi:hypothetical protein
MNSQILESTSQQRVTTHGNQSEDLPEFQVRAPHISDNQPAEAQRGYRCKAAEHEEWIKDRQATY